MDDRNTIESKNMMRTSTLLLLAATLSSCATADVPDDPGVDNNLPIAAPGRSRQVDVGARVTLDASASSDADGDDLTYRWNLSSPPTSRIDLDATDRVTASFSPDVEGVYSLTLIVFDGLSSSAPATVTVTAREIDLGNAPPVADAGVDRIVEAGEPVTLDGSASRDSDGDTITYQWSLVSSPPGSGATISALGDIRPSLTTDLPGAYVAQLIVSDGKDTSAPARVTLTAQSDTPPVNQAPVAKAGEDAAVTIGEMVELDGSASRDPDGTDLTYQWSLTTPGASAATLNSLISPSPSFTVDVEGEYIASLVVSDGELTSAPDDVRVVVTRDNLPPIARAGSNRDVLIGAPVELNGTSSSDPDGDNLSYSWSLTLPQGSAATFDDATSATPMLTPDVPGLYLASLTVNDGSVDSAPVTVGLTAASGCVRISEYVEGSGTSKAYEIVNCSAGPLDLAGVGACLYSNDKTSAGACSATWTGPPVTLAAGDVHVVCNPNSSSTIPASSCDETHSSANFNGDDRLLLFLDVDASNSLTVDDVIEDRFGDPDDRPDTRLWEDVTYVRCDATAYDPAAGPFDQARLDTLYATLPLDTFDRLGAPTAASDCP